MLSMLIKLVVGSASFRSRYNKFERADGTGKGIVKFYVHALFDSLTAVCIAILEHRFNDAYSLTVAGDWVVTSPNRSTIPFINLKDVELRPRTDGRLGVHDFTLWPQIFSTRYAHRMLIKVKPSLNTDPLCIMYWTPGAEDFELLQSSSFPTLGRLSRSRVDEMELLTKGISERVKALHKKYKGHTLDDLPFYATNMRHGII